MKYSVFASALAISLLAVRGLAQSNYTGYSADNGSGYTGSYVQPASIANSVYRFSVTTSFCYLQTNNYIGRNGSGMSWGAFSNQKDRYKNHNSLGYQAINGSGDLIGAHYEINHHNSIGYSFRFRMFANVGGLPEELTKAIFNKFDATNVFDTPFTSKRLHVTQFAYNEHRFNYARVIIDAKDRMLKAGIAFKSINGLDATFLFAENASISLISQGGGAGYVTGTEFQYGRAEKKNMFTSRRSGYGLDLGAVYEFRPDHKDFFYDMDGVKNIERFNEPKYKYRIGASITDIGRVRFSKDTNSYNFTAANIPIITSSIYDPGITFQDIFNGSALKNFDNIADVGTKSTDQDDKFNMNLPTALNLQFDYHYKKGIYFNYTSSNPIYRLNDPSRSYNRSIHTFSARMERNSWSVAIPISFQRNATINLGFAGRYGLKKYPSIQIFGGAQNINNFFGVRARYTSNIFLGLIFAERYTVISDKDGDKISDGKDDCPYDPGPASLKGCPDTDGDGITDKRDFCIYMPGTPANNGCPDSDKDGVLDFDDQCPEVPGLPIHYGCPDTDKDGVIDAADRCPDVPGVELNNGCPFENPGCCMDNDGDGVSNTVDKCPEVAGSVYNEGCPIDSSNINKVGLNEQKEQKDPNHTNQKTEEIKKDNPIAETQEGTRITEMIDRTSDIETMSIYFNVDDATVLAEYDEKIRKLADKYDFTPNSKYRLVLIGHTDNDGSDAYNLILSKKRAEVVRRKFESNDVDYDLITVYYFGENRPMKSNDNNENKKFNRRVEVIVQKKDQVEKPETIDPNPKKKAEPTKGTTKPDPAKPAPAKPSPAKPDPTKPDPAKTTPTKPGTTQPAKTAPATTQPAGTTPAKPDPKKPTTPAPQQPVKKP